MPSPHPPSLEPKPAECSLAGVEGGWMKKCIEIRRESMNDVDHANEQQKSLNTTIKTACIDGIGGDRNFSFFGGACLERSACSFAYVSI